MDSSHTETGLASLPSCYEIGNSEKDFDLIHSLCGVCIQAESQEQPARKKVKMDKLTSIGSPHIDVRHISMDSLLETLIASQPYLYLKGEVNTFITVATFLRYGVEELRLVISWAMKIPKFASLDEKTKRAMIHASYMNIMVLRLAYRSLHLTDKRKMMFAQNITLGVDEMERLGWSRQVAEGTLDLMVQIRKHKIDLAEYSVLAALVLTSPDADGISDPMAVFELQGEILKELQMYTKRRDLNWPTRYSRILLTLPYIRNLGAISMENYNSLNEGCVIQLDAIFQKSLMLDEKDQSHFSAVNPME